MSRFVKTALTLWAGLLVVAVAGCGENPVGSVEGPMFARARGTATQYLLIASSGSLPASLAAQVKRAGGKLTGSLPAIGVAMASGDATFARRAAGIAGISVVPDLVVQWIAPPEVETLAFAEVGNPPASADDDFFFDLQWGADAVDAPEAWNAGARGAGVRVAVLDAGIQASHPDLAPNLNTTLSRSFVPNEGFDTGPGFFFNHGTHVSGIIGAADNAFGVIGIAPEVELVAVKVLSQETGSGSFGGIIAGIVYAADVDADVINMSLGATLGRRGEVYDPAGQLVERIPARDVNLLAAALGHATSYAYQRGSTIIASAGNAGTNGDKDKDRIHVPSSSPHVINISATTPIGWALDPATNLDIPTSYTNYGSSDISFAAPGGDGLLPGNAFCTVVVTVPCWVFDLVFSTIAGGWGWAGGTSMAAPHASGVAAIIIGQNNGSMHPAQVEAALRDGADDLGKPGHDPFFGDGRVNAGNTVP